MKKLLLISVLIITGCAEYNDFANPSPANIQSRISRTDDFTLCSQYLGDYALLRSEEFNYRNLKPVVDEVKRRNLDCNSFPELSKYESWLEDWVKEYEESLEKWKNSSSYQH